MSATLQTQPINWGRVLRISAAYIAFLIGSGFATGQEALQFFVGYGAMGLLGALLTTLILVYSCASMLRAGQRQTMVKNQEGFVYFCGPYIGVLLTWYTMILIVAISTVMVAGAAATLAQAFSLPVELGAAAIALLTTGSLLLGLNRLLSILSFIGPLIILLALISAGATLLNGMPSLSSISAAESLVPYKSAGSWWYSALLYVGVVMPGLVGLLPIIGSTTQGRCEVYAISLIGPLFLIGTLTLVVLAMFSSINQVATSEIPLMHLAQNFTPMLGAFFAVAIFLGIFTTLTPLIWTVCTRFSEEGTVRYRVLIVVLGAIAYVGGTVLSFSQLLNILYPTVGTVGLVILVCQIFTDVKIGRDRKLNATRAKSSA